jgi:hypothetical protein
MSEAACCRAVTCAGPTSLAAKVPVLSHWSEDSTPSVPTPLLAVHHIAEPSFRMPRTLA